MKRQSYPEQLPNTDHKLKAEVGSIYALFLQILPGHPVAHSSLDFGLFSTLTTANCTESALPHLPTYLPYQFRKKFLQKLFP